MVYHSRVHQRQTGSDFNSNRVLVLGASGLLGSNVFNAFSTKFETHGTYFRSENYCEENLYKVDASDFRALKSRILELNPSRIINCLGLTSVEECESRPEASWKLNSEIPIFISYLAKKIGAQLIHVSTDHLFSKVEVPRSESEQVIPINQYGFTKMAAEKTILKQNEYALILRTNFFGHSEKESKSILDFAINSMKTNTVINGFDDVLFTPVGVSEISNFLINPISLKAKGLLNFASSETISKYEFMVMVSQVLKKYDAVINRTSISNSELSVPRPNYMALSATRLTNEFAYNLPTIQEMLENEIAGIV